MQSVNDNLIGEKDLVVMKSIAAQSDSLLALEPGDRIVAIANLFLNTPYLGGTLDRDTVEKVVVNLCGFDCVTFVESVLALSGSVDGDVVQQSRKFIKELERIRYRDGLCDGYCSRLHYFSQWLKDNEKKGLLHAVIDSVSCKPYVPDVGFMSNHPEKYSQLVNHPERIDSMKIEEGLIGIHEFCMIPQEDISKNSALFKDGDVVGIITNIKDLDISHVGFISIIKGEAYFLHASSQFKKIMLTQANLERYVKSVAHMTGIVVFRVNGKN